MVCKSLIATLVATGVSFFAAAHRVLADSVALEGGYVNPVTFDGTNFQLIDGDTYNPTTYNAYPYTFDLNFAFESSTAVSTPVDLDGDLDIQGTFNGTYTFYVGSSVVSTGAATMHGEFGYEADFDEYDMPTFTNGLLSQTSGTGLITYPGVTQFNFSGISGLDGDYFQGSISPFTAAAPLPSSAAMALFLITSLIPLVRRRAHLDLRPALDTPLR